EIPARATFRTPWQANLGLRYRATEALTLNAQATRFGWSEFDAIRIGAPINNAIPENYRDTWALAGGADYALSPALTIRGGVQWDQTPT
ncbi:outer membrane protein transport protein, partial [Acinetobacter baumannii]